MRLRVGILYCLTLTMTLCTIAVLPVVGFAAGQVEREEVWTDGGLLYGQPLSALVLSGIFVDPQSGQTVSGRLEWEQPDQLLPVGERAAAYRFIPADSARYLPYSGEQTVSVSPRKLDVYITGVLAREYDGSAAAQAEGVVCSGAVAGDDVSAAATVYYRDAAAGMSKPVERVEVRLAGADSDNYTPQLAMQPSFGNILPYSGAVCPGGVVSLSEGDGGSFAVNLRESLPLEGPGEPGQVLYSGPDSFSGDTGLLREEPVLEGHLLYLELDTGATEGRSVTMRFTASSANYRPVEASLRLEFLADRQVSGVSTPSRTYTALPYRPQGSPEISGSPLAQAQYRYTGRGETSYDSAQPPTDAGEYHLQIAAGQQGVRPQELDFTIFRAPLTITPVDCEIVAGQPLPQAFDFHIETLLGGDTAAVLQPPPQAAADVAGSGEPGVYPIRVLTLPQAKNYSVAALPGQLTIRAGAGESALYQAPEPGPGGWYNAPVTVRPAQPALYNEIALQPGGPYADHVTVQREGSGGVPLYLRGPAGERGDVQFPCRLDRTPPAIDQVTCVQSTGAVTVTASDALSGVASLQLLGPGGGEVAGENGRFVITESGRYTVMATDVAGNRATERYDLVRENSGDTGGGSVDNGQAQRGGSGGSASKGSSGGSLRDGDSADDFWNTVAERIRAAQPGGTVRVMTAVNHSIPAAVLRALRESGATLRLIRPDGDVLLPGARIPPLSGAAAYTVQEVLDMLLPEGEPDAPEPDTDGPEQSQPQAEWQAPAALPAAPLPERGEDAPETAEPVGGGEPGEDAPLPDGMGEQDVAERLPAAPVEVPASAGGGKKSPAAGIVASLLGASAISLAGYAFKLHL